VRTAQLATFCECGERKDAGRNNKWLRDCRVPDCLGVTRGAVGNQINIARVAERTQQVAGAGALQPWLEKSWLL
jgi:hypothetical protein